METQEAWQFENSNFGNGENSNIQNFESDVLLDGEDSAKEAYEGIAEFETEFEPSEDERHGEVPKSLPDLTKAAHRNKGTAPWQTHASPLQPRPRPNLSEAELARSNLGVIMSTLMNEEVLDSVKDSKLCSLIEQAQGDEALVLETAHRLAMNVSQTDMSWKKELAGPDRQLVIEAYTKEYESLTSTVLRRVLEGDPVFDKAKELATSGRFLLDKKRSGVFKARGVKRGFEENLKETDGDNFNYYAHVAEVKAIRATLLRRARRGRKLAIKDVTTAFLQSISYPEGKKKYIRFKSPITGEWMWFEQSGPIYGENSAPVFWGEKTLAPFLTCGKEGCNMERGDNHKSVYYNKERDLLVLTYVDDFLVDGEKEDIMWFDAKLDSRFKCKPIEFVTEGEVIDYIGMGILLTKDRIYLSMENYIEKMETELTKLGMIISKRNVSIPFSGEIDGESERLPPKLVRLLLTALGCCGWCAHTVRLDIGHAFSRNGQHTSNPTVSLLDSVTHMVRYLIQHKSLCISQSLYPEDEKIGSVGQVDNQLGFTFWCDTDHAGNSEVQNKRRSQNALIVCIDGAPFDWVSKASSVCFATPLIGEAHADVSTGAVEIYGVGNATMDILDDAYLIEEMGMEFPYPFELQMDNTTAIAFCEETVRRSKLKHIDCRQEWCRMIRDKGIVVAKHVNSSENVADILTKVLEPRVFIGLRDQLMECHPFPGNP